MRLDFELPTDFEWEEISKSRSITYRLEGLSCSLGDGDDGDNDGDDNDGDGRAVGSLRAKHGVPGIADLGTRPPLRRETKTDTDTDTDTDRPMRSGLDAGVLTS